MKRWLIRSGPVGTALLWGVGWFIGAGGIMEAFVDPHGEIVDIWPAAMGFPGFVSGALFWVVLRIAEGRRGADEVPLGRLITWGAVSGALVGAMLFTMFVGSGGKAEVGAVQGALPDQWLRAVVVIGIPTLLSAISAVIAAFLFRWARRETGQSERASTHP